MTTPPSSTGASQVPVRALRRLMREPQPPQPPAEHCALCGEALPEEHRHMVDRTDRALLCACTACALLFEREGAAGGRYVTVPRRYLALTGFRMSDEQWDDLRIPVDMAYIFQSSAVQRPVAFYPGPAGATESLLRLEHWESLVMSHSILETLTPDVEALLISRQRDAHEYYIVPIDACYQLVGIIRTAWRGLSGGEAVWAAIRGYFDALRARSQAEEGATDA